MSFAIIAIYRGWWVPRSTVQLVQETYGNRLRDKDREIDTWKIAFHQSESARAEQGKQMNELLDYARTSAHVLESLPRPDPKELEAGP